jgi:putative aminopeptidase FrvX
MRGRASACRDHAGRVLPCVAAFVIAVAGPSSLFPQAGSSSSPLETYTLRLARLTAVTGYEDAAAESVLVALPGAVRDAAGNVVLTRGRGLPARVAACFLDEPGHVVGGITADGYLTLRRAGSPPEGVAPERFLFGQRVTVYGADGPVEGVAGVRSIHLQRGRSGGAPPADAPPGDLLDEIFVDVGAADAHEARALGIRPALPVARSRQVQR